MAKSVGFTLAELLIALAILGVIATFSIPKVMTAQQNNRSNAVAKETIAAVSTAFKNYQQNNTVTAATTLPEILLTSINYIKLDTAGQLIDSIPTETSLTCGTWAPCFRLTSGATIYYYDSKSFGGTSAINAIVFFVDPDSVYGGLTTGPSKSVEALLYYNGRISTRCCTAAGTTDSDASSYPADPTLDPSWFSWD